MKCVTDTVLQEKFIRTLDEVIHELDKQSYEFSGKDY